MTETAARTLPQIFEAMEETLLSLGTVLRSLSPDDWHKPTGCPEWDVQDVASHVIGLEDRIAGLPEPEHVLPESLSHARDPAKAEMEVAVDYRRGLSSGEILAQFDASIRRGMELRRATSRDPDEVTDGPFGWKMPFSQLMSIRTFDIFAHEQDVRRAVGQEGNISGLAAKLTADLMVQMGGGLLASRVDELKDREVTISVAHPPTEAIAQITAGTESSRHIATDIAMPFGELVARFCGRADIDDDRVTITGDPELAAKVLDAMGFTP